MAARVFGPGRTRLKLIKLAHNLGNSEAVIELPRGGYDETPGGLYKADAWSAADILGDAG